MPLRKYRSVADMPPQPWRTPLDPVNLRLACDLSALAVRLRPKRFPPGVHKHRSTDDARRVRATWEGER